MTVKTVATAAKAVASKTVDAVKPEVPTAPRQWAHLDSVANAKRGSDIMVRRAEIAAMEASMSAGPINAGGWNDPGRVHMQAQQAHLLADKREQLKAVEAETGDTVVYRYCQDILTAQGQPVTGVTINGQPLARGSAPSMVAPGVPR